MRLKLKFCEDRDILGSDFIVMERREGIVIRRRIPDSFARMNDAPRKMSIALIDALADLHAVDYEAIGLGDLGHPAGFIERQVEGWYKRWQAAKNEDVPEMDAVYQWLKENLPASTGAALVHNDFKLDNIMLAAENPGRIVAVFDWDMCTLGDPLSDVGTLLAYWTEPTDPPYFQGASMMPTGDLGFLTRAELIERYAARSGRPVNNINFYHALGLFRIVVIVAQIYIRFVRGQTQDQRFAQFGMMIPIMAQAAQATALAGSRAG